MNRRYLWLSLAIFVLAAHWIVSNAWTPGHPTTGTPAATNFLRGDGAWQPAPPSGAVNPATCTIGDMYFNTAENLEYYCSALNTWTSKGVGSLDNPYTPNQTFSGTITVSAKLIIPVGSVAATCTAGELFIDTDATDEFCVCSATNTWGCFAMTDGSFDASGPVD